MEVQQLSTLLSGNSYPGRGIVLGRSKDGKTAMIAYFIMGRSVNSRNRVFEENDRGGIRTKAFDESKMEDPSLIIYNPVLCLDGKTLSPTVTRRIPSMTLWQEGKCYRHALLTREFEPDAPTILPESAALSSRTATTTCPS